MPLWEVSFRARYDYPFIALSAEIPETPISMWCVWNRELLQVPTRDPAVLGTVERAIRRSGKVVEEWVDAQDGRLFLLQCTCGRYDSYWNIVDANECFEAPPAVFQDGWGYFRALTLTDDRLRGLLGDFRKRGTAELLRKRELPLSALPTSVWVHTLFGELTSRQMDALLQAHRAGYYQSPRQVTTADVAKGAGIGRSTYEEHLRKGENRILEALVPYLQVYRAADRDPDRLAGRATPVPPVEELPRSPGRPRAAA